MAELQTVAAAVQLTELSCQAVKFLRRVLNANVVARGIIAQIESLENVLHGITAVLKVREGRAVTSGSDAQVAIRVRQSVLSCTTTLHDLRSSLGGFGVPETNGTTTSIADRLRVAYRHGTVDRVNGELEARIAILSTDLIVLQLFNHESTDSRIQTNHDELLQAISRLGEQVIAMRHMMHDCRGATSQTERGASAASPADQTSSAPSQNAATSLVDCLRFAEDVHERFSERFTSEAIPDNRSERMRRDTVNEDIDMAHGSNLVPTETLATELISSSPSSRDSVRDETIDSDEEEELWPLEILSGHIEDYLQRAFKEQGLGHYGQAEHHLDLAMRNSEAREAHYGVHFAERARMQENMAFLFQKQSKFADAVAIVRRLLREQHSCPAPNTEDRAEHNRELGLTQARQHQLLASIYHDRHMSDVGTPLRHATDDLATAESHAKKAFKKRWAVHADHPRPGEETEQFTAGVRFLVQILEQRGNTVEATGLSKRFIDGSSISSESMRRTSTAQSRQQTEPDLVTVDKHELLVDAIKFQDTEAIHDLLGVGDLDLEKPSKEQKTFLTYAVEARDHSTVHRLLTPDVGVDVNSANRRGMTALHFASMAGLPDMVKCLLDHDAEVAPVNKDGETPMVKAVQVGHTDVVRVLFDRDESTLEFTGVHEWSLLHYAVNRPAAQPNFEMINLLLDLSPDLKDSIDQDGQTALHHTVKNEKIDHIRVLLKHTHTLDINAPDSTARSPLYLAASKPWTPHRGSIVQLLLSNGASRNGRRPPRDYPEFHVVPRRFSTTSHVSVSTTGTAGTTSTNGSVWSRMIARVR